MKTVTAPPSEYTEAEFEQSWRDHECHILLSHLRRQRADGTLPRPQDKPDQEEPAATSPTGGPSVAIFDKPSLLKQIRLAGGDDSDGDGPSAASVSGDEQTRLAQLRTLACHDAIRRLVVAEPTTRDRLALLREECPGFVEVIALVERAVALSAVAGTAIAFPPLLLVGPPGLGKTHFSRRLGKALGAEQHAFSCSNNSDAQALLVGHPPTWRGARMGVLTEALLGGETGNPLVVLDEIDKFVTHSSEKPYNALLGLLEPENASALVDEFLRIPFDLSRCLVIATANELDILPDFIQDRFLVVKVEPPDGAMLRAIADRMAAEILAAHGDAFAPPDEAVIASLASTNPRGIRRIVTLALGFAALAGRRHLAVDDVADAEAIVGKQAARETIGFIRSVRGPKAKGEKEQG